MILLDDEGIKAAKVGHVAILVDGKPQVWEADRFVTRATGKKILIKLQKIYNLPDEGMFHKQMGEFIEELVEEVR